MTTPVLDIADAVADATAAALESVAPAPVVDSPADAVDAPAVAENDTAGDSDTTEAVAGDAAAAAADALVGDSTAEDAAVDEENSDTGNAEGAEGSTEADAGAVVLPEGFVAVPVVADDLATEFVLRDAEGEVEVPSLIVEYKANGKVRQDRLDQVVKLAQWGVYNQEREAKVKEVEQQAQAVQAEREQVAQILAEREAQIERLLTDDDFLYAVRDAYANENAPERRAARAEEQLQQWQLEQEVAKISTEGQSFYQGQIEPALSLIAQSLPSVSAEELSDRMMYAMQAHVETGPGGVKFIPPSRYEAVKQYIVQDLAPWAQFEHHRRSAGTESSTPANARADVIDLASARVASQKAKRALGQQLKPVGASAAKETAAPRRVAKPATIDDAVDSALSEVLASLR
jgi:hypothetical protein